MNPPGFSSHVRTRRVLGYTSFKQSFTQQHKGQNEHRGESVNEDNNEESLLRVVACDIAPEPYILFIPGIGDLFVVRCGHEGADLLALTSSPHCRCYDLADRRDQLALCVGG